MGKRESLQLWSTSPTVPAFVAVPSQPRPQLSTYPSPAHPQQQQQPPYYQQEQHLTPAEKEKQDYYGDQDHWADAPAYPSQAHQANDFGASGGRKAAPPALTILQPPRATFTEAPATPSSPAALAFGDEASSVRGREARHRANKSMDWSRFSILVKEKERKGEKSSEWLESKQSTWRKYHKLGWLGAVVVIAIVAGALAYHFTHLKDNVEPTSLKLGGFNGENENKTSTASDLSSAAANSGSSAHSSTTHSSSSSYSTIARIVATTSSSSAAAATSSAAIVEEEEQVTTTTARVVTTTRAAAKVVETTTTSARAVRTTEASTTSSSASLKASAYSTTSAKGSAATAEDRLRKRFFNPVRIDYVAIGEGEEETLVKRAEWEKIVFSPKEEGSANAKRSTGGWEETEMMFEVDEEQQEEAAQTLEKRDWRSIQFSRPNADAELGVKRHLSHRRHQRM